MATKDRLSVLVQMFAGQLSMQERRTEFQEEHGQRRLLDT